MKKTVAYAVFCLPGLLGPLLLGGCGGASGANHANGPGPSITAEPANQTAVAGQTVMFTVEAAGASPLSYQWRMNGSAISGATLATYTTSVTSASQSGTEYAAINLMDAADVSQDGQHIEIVGGDTTGSSPENVFVYNFAANTKGPVYTTTTCTGSVNAPNNDCLHKLILTPDNNALIDFDPNGEGLEQGDRL